MQFHMRRIFGVLSVLVVLTMVLSACTTVAPAAQAPARLQAAVKAGGPRPRQKPSARV